MTQTEATQDKVEAIERLEAIKEEMQALLEEAKHLVMQYADRTVSDRAQAYWVPHIEQSLETTGYDVDMIGTIEEMKESIQETVEE